MPRNEYTDPLASHPPNTMPRRRTYPGGFRCRLISLGVLLTLASVFYAFSASIVQQNQIFTQDAAQGSSFTALAASQVPTYNAAGFAPIDGSQTEIYSFDWFVYATDSLRPFVMVYSLVAALLAVLVPLDTLTGVLYQPVVIIALLIELAKLVYFLLILGGVLGLSCASYAFCRNRNPAITGTTDGSFIFELISTGVFSVVYIALTTLPGTVRRAHLSSDPIGARQSPPSSDFEIDEFPRSGLRYQTTTRRQRPRKSKKTLSAAEQAINDIPLLRVPREK